MNSMISPALATPVSVPVPALRADMVGPMAFFAAEELYSQDIDPVYPVLRQLYAMLALDEEAALWFTTLYLAFYNLPSALTAFRARPTPGPLPPELNRLPTATERRNLRGGKVALNLDSYLATAAHYGSSQRAFLGGEADPAPHRLFANYAAFEERSQLIWGNGRWATFKWAELLQQVHGYPLLAPDMRLEFCTGPLEGLRYMFHWPEQATPPGPRTLEGWALTLHDALMWEGAGTQKPLPFLPWEQLETVLCDFNSMRKGHYYPGHDIDLMLEQMGAAPLPPADRELLLAARAKSFPPEYLGELAAPQRLGVDKPRRAIFKKEGRIVTRRPDYCW